MSPIHVIHAILGYWPHVDDWKQRDSVDMLVRDFQDRSDLRESRQSIELALSLLICGGLLDRDEIPPMHTVDGEFERAFVFRALETAETDPLPRRGKTSPRRRPSVPRNSRSQRFPKLRSRLPVSPRTMVSCRTWFQVLENKERSNECKRNSG